MDHFLEQVEESFIKIITTKKLKRSLEELKICNNFFSYDLDQTSRQALRSGWPVADSCSLKINAARAEPSPGGLAQTTSTESDVIERSQRLPTPAAARPCVLSTKVVVIIIIKLFGAVIVTKYVAPLNFNILMPASVLVVQLP